MIVPLERKRTPSRGNDSGFALIVGLLLVAVLMLLGTTAMMTTMTDLKISANYVTGSQAFDAAEAGIEEARARMKADAANPIADAYPTQAQWNTYIGTVSNAQAKGYDSGSTMHTQTASLQSTLSYTVRIRHSTNVAGQVLYWGDADGDGIPERTANALNAGGLANPNIYLITGYGSASGATKSVEAEISRVPPLTLPSTLYVEAPTTIQGAGTRIIGMDQCGGAGTPGISTPLAPSAVNGSGNTLIAGATSPTGNPPSIVGGINNLDVQAMIDSQKGDANYTYSVNSAMHTGMNWGTPVPGATPQDASSCGERNIVYYSTGNTFIKLTGGSAGCGILLVEGDLELDGGFLWYGVVLVSGSVIFTGDGVKNITGGVIAGRSANVATVGGQTSIIRCSAAISRQTCCRPLRRLSWKEENI